MIVIGQHWLKLLGWPALGLLLFLAAPDPSKAQTVIRVPFENKGLILIKARVNGHAGTFIFDTGAQRSVIAPSLCDGACSSGKKKSGEFQGLGNDRLSVALAPVVFEIGPHMFQPTAIIAPTSQFSKQVGTTIDGIVGLDVLKFFRSVSVDFSTREVVLESLN